MKNNNFLCQFLTGICIALIVISAIMFSGCGAAYRAKRCRALNCCPQVNDSTHIIDSTYLVPVPYTVNGDTAWLSILAKCDSAGNAHYQLYQYYQGKYIAMTANTSGDTMYIYSRLPGRIDTVLVQGKIRTEYKDKITEKITNVLTRSQRTMITIGWVLSVICIILLLYAIYRIVRKFV